MKTLDRSAECTACAVRGKRSGGAEYSVRRYGAQSEAVRACVTCGRGVYLCVTFSAAFALAKADANRWREFWHKAYGYEIPTGEP